MGCPLFCLDCWLVRCGFLFTLYTTTCSVPSKKGPFPCERAQNRYLQNSAIKSALLELVVWIDGEIRDGFPSKSSQNSTANKHLEINQSQRTFCGWVSYHPVLRSQGFDRPNIRCISRQDSLMFSLETSLTSPCWAAFWGAAHIGLCPWKGRVQEINLPVQHDVCRIGFDYLFFFACEPAFWQFSMRIVFRS